jgi:hypothetical protein
MSKKSQATTEQGKERKKRTQTFLLELPLQVNESQAARLRAHLEAGRQFYNAVLSEGQRRLRKMRADPAWQAARALARSQKQERASATIPACALCSKNPQKANRDCSFGSTISSLPASTGMIPS